MDKIDFLEIFNSYKNEPFIISKNILTFQETLQQINNSIIYLQENNFKPGEKVTIIADQEIQFILLFWALILFGIVVVPISNKLPKNQILNMLSSINCSKLFLNEKSIGAFSEPKIDIFQINEFVKKNMNNHYPEDLKPISVERDCTIIFTSGSSGIPKAVLHTVGNHYFSALGSNKNIPFGNNKKWLLSLPVYHVSGLSILFRTMFSGGAVVIPDPDINLTENINRFQITHLSLVPTQLKQLLLNNESIDLLKKLDAILIGGSNIPLDIIKKSCKHKLPIYTTYGSTEMASQVTTTKPNENIDKLFTSGKLLDHRQIKIANDCEILLKGKTLFKGYIEGNKTIQPIDEDGWFYSGDLGKNDEAGYLNIIGRKDNMFISGGENIYPEEIENHLMNISEIEQAIVFDIPDKKFGARPVAIIKANQFDLIDQKYLEKYLTEFLPKFKIPDAFYKWPQEYDSIKPNVKKFKKYLSEKSLKLLFKKKTKN